MVTYLSSLVSCVVGRQKQCKQISLACVGSARSVWATLGLPPLTACVLSQSTLLRLQVALQGNCLKQALPGLCALPRSKLLRFRFSGTPQRHRLRWVCFLCPSQVGAAQVTRCLASTPSPGGQCVLSPPSPTTTPFQLLSFLGAQWKHLLRCAVRLLWGAYLWLRLSWGCQ